jgi:hypothetical protein
MKLKVFVVLASAGHVSGNNRWKPKSILYGKWGKEKDTSIDVVPPSSCDSGSDNSLQETKPFLNNVRGGGKSEEDSKATIAASVFNLVNNVAGAGILTLSAGMASGTGWIPAILICAVLGSLSAHCFSLIGNACELTGEHNFKVHYFLSFFLNLITCKFISHLLSIHSGPLGSNHW